MYINLKRYLIRSNIWLFTRTITVNTGAVSVCTKGFKNVHASMRIQFVLTVRYMYYVKKKTIFGTKNN